MEPGIDILLVDDEPRNLEVLEAILADDGYHLLRAEGAERALQLLLRHDVAVIVLDIKMPVVSGFELAKIIKGMKKFREVPILFLTAYMLEDRDVLEGYGSGAVDYLTKPVNPQILRSKVAVFAELFRKTRALAELNLTLEQRVEERTAELASSEAALREAGRQKDEFLAILAHELRNPLAPLRTGLDLLLRVGPASMPADRTLAAMNRQLSHMVRLVDDLLDVSRISRGTLELKKERVELGELVQAAIEASRPHLEQRAQVITVDVAGPVFAIVDPVRVSQILGNLFHNAATYTPQGGSIRVELVELAGVARIRLVDSGVGIAPEELDRVFEMFARIERSSPIAGRGLGIGLALARRLAEMHGGTLTASSEGEGQGTTFTLQLPSTIVTEPVSLAAPAPRGSPNIGLEIVLVEDHVDNAETLAEWLQSLGHIVRVAHDGRGGLDLVRAAPPRVVICDIGLPDIDGNEVCRSIRGLVIDQPVMVALSGWGMPDDLARSRAAGFDHHLVKPVAPEKLNELLRGIAAA